MTVTGRAASAALMTLAVILAVSGAAMPASATNRATAHTGSWPVTPGSLGSLYGSHDPGGLASVRVWGSAIWCYVQPTPDAPIAQNLDRLLAPSLDPIAATGGGTAIVTIGHPAPWVFDNHPRAVARTKLWACGDHASGVSIPSPASLRPARDGAPSVQAQRYAAYVSAVVDYLTSRYSGSIRIILETWNEPNLTSGLNPRLRIPGAARSVREAVASLHAYESIAHDVIRVKGASGSISLGSSALFTRSNQFSRLYLKAHSRKRRIDALHFNIYGFTGGSPTRAVQDWDRRAAAVRSRVAKYRALRSLPMVVTEANLNLVNNDRNRSNLSPAFTDPTQQRRMATATQMNAYYRGFSGVHWLVPWRQQQAAVFVQTLPGNAARDALATLQEQLMGRTLGRCWQTKKVRTCTFKDPVRGDARVLWRTSGVSTVRSPRAAELVDMTGATRPVSAGQRIKVGTTPVVLR